MISKVEGAAKPQFQLLVRPSLLFLSTPALPVFLALPRFGMQSHRSNFLSVTAQVEGTGLRDVMNKPGIVGSRTTSNHVMEVESVLGIEAARCVCRCWTVSTERPSCLKRLL